MIREVYTQSWQTGRGRAPSSEPTLGVPTTLSQQALLDLLMNMRDVRKNFSLESDIKDR